MPTTTTYTLCNALLENARFAYGNHFVKKTMLDDSDKFQQWKDSCDRLCTACQNFFFAETAHKVTESHTKAVFDEIKLIRDLVGEIPTKDGKGKRITITSENMADSLFRRAVACSINSNAKQHKTALENALEELKTAKADYRTAVKTSFPNVPNGTNPDFAQPYHDKVKAAIDNVNNVRKTADVACYIDGIVKPDKFRRAFEIELRKVMVYYVNHTHAELLAEEKARKAAEKAAAKQTAKQTAKAAAPTANENPTA